MKIEEDVSTNVITDAAGPTAHAKPIEDALTTFLCLVDDDMLKHIRECTVDEAHRVKEESSWDMTVGELKAFIPLIYIRGYARWKKHGFGELLVGRLKLCIFQGNHVPKQVQGNNVIFAF